MAVILITGANGQLGNELKAVSKNYCGYDFHFTDIDTLDICDNEKVTDYVKRTDPAWIINCAAYNLVDRAESEYDTAMRINCTGVSNIANAIRGTECRLIHISSDYVFDGRSCTPYNEDAHTAPVNLYGRTKLEGERAALQHNGTLIIRTSWLYSSSGSNFVRKIISRAREADSLDVVFDQAGTPTYALDLAEAIMNIISPVIRNQRAFIPGIYHYSSEGLCSWYDFAVAIVEEAGIRCKVRPVLSSEFRSAARRPSYSVLDKTKIKEDYNLEIPHWRNSLKACIKLLI